MSYSLPIQSLCARHRSHEVHQWSVSNATNQEQEGCHLKRGRLRGGWIALEGRANPRSVAVMGLGSRDTAGGRVGTALDLTNRCAIHSCKAGERSSDTGVDRKGQGIGLEGLWSMGKGVTGECLIPWASILRDSLLYKGEFIHLMSKHRSLEFLWAPCRKRRGWHRYWGAI